MKITKKQLKEMIDEVLQEFVSSKTSRGAKKAGHKSPERKTAQSKFDIKSSDYKAKEKVYQTKQDDYAAKASESVPLQYRSAPGKGGSYTYHTTKQRGGDINPAYTTYQSDLKTKQLARDSAATDKSTADTERSGAETTLNTRKAADLEKEKTPSKEKVQTGGGKAGKGKKKN